MDAVRCVKLLRMPNPNPDLNPGPNANLSLHADPDTNPNPNPNPNSDSLQDAVLELKLLRLPLILTLQLKRFRYIGDYWTRVKVNRRLDFEPTLNMEEFVDELGENPPPYLTPTRLTPLQLTPSHIASFPLERRRVRTPYRWQTHAPHAPTPCVTPPSSYQPM